MSDKVLDKVRALLAKAESTQYPEEAKAFTAKAVELMGRYAIDEAALRFPGQAVTFTNEIFTVQAPYVTTKGYLLGVIANFNRCQVIQLNSKGPNRKMHLMGRSDDIAFVKMLYTSLLVQQATEMAGKSPHKGSERPWENLRTWRNSFMYGFANEVATRLKALNKATEAEVQGTSTALVLVDDKEKLNAYVSELYPSTRLIKRRPVVDPHGYKSGKDAGGRADLGQSRLGNQRELGHA